MENPNFRHLIENLNRVRLDELAERRIVLRPYEVGEDVEGYINLLEDLFRQLMGELTLTIVPLEYMDIPVDTCFLSDRSSLFIRLMCLSRANIQIREPMIRLLDYIVYIIEQSQAVMEHSFSHAITNADIKVDDKLCGLDVPDETAVTYLEKRYTQTMFTHESIHEFYNMIVEERNWDDIKHRTGLKHSDIPRLSMKVIEIVKNWLKEITDYNSLMETICKCGKRCLSPCTELRRSVRLRSVRECIYDPRNC